MVAPRDLVTFLARLEGTSIQPGRRTSISSAFKPIIVTLSNLPGPSPSSRRYTPKPHVAPPGLRSQAARPTHPPGRSCRRALHPRGDGVKVACNDPTTASGLAPTSASIFICWARKGSVSPSESRWTLTRRKTVPGGAVGGMIST